MTVPGTRPDRRRDRPADARKLPAAQDARLLAEVVAQALDDKPARPAPAPVFCTGLNPRWLLEPLRGQAVAGLVDSAGGEVFEFSGEAAARLADEETSLWVRGRGISRRCRAARSRGPAGRVVPTGPAAGWPTSPRHRSSATKSHRRRSWAGEGAEGGGRRRAVAANETSAAPERLQFGPSADGVGDEGGRKEAFGEDRWAAQPVQ